MTTSNSYKRLIQSSMLSMSSLMLLSSAPADAVDVATTDSLTKQAFELCQQGKLKEARELQAQAIAKNPNDWAAHEVQSYFSWLQGDVVQATAEAQKAVELDPKQATALTNLGQIQERVYQYAKAIPAYDKARQVAPDDWVPWIGLARSFVLNNNSHDGYAVLKFMESKKTRSFDWYYQIGRTYLYMDRADLAVAPLAKAKKLATTNQQKSDAAVNGLLASLRTSQEAGVKSTADDVFSTYHPQDHELYIRSASLLLPPLEPAAGKRFLKVSTENLTSAKDGDAFFKLGQIFEAKANAVSDNADAHDKWLANAESAYRQAIAVDPTQGNYHLALAGTLDKQSKDAEVVEQLTKAQALDSKDKLAPFLLAASNKGHLSEVEFKMDGIGCACKIKLIHNALEKIDGVTLASMGYDKPYRGKVLIDQSVTSVDDALLQSLKSVFPFEFKDKERTPGVKAETTSTRPVQSIAQAVSLAQSMRNGDPMQFVKPQMRSAVGDVQFELPELVAAKKPRAGEKTPL